MPRGGLFGFRGCGRRGRPGVDIRGLGGTAAGRHAGDHQTDTDDRPAEQQAPRPCLEEAGLARPGFFRRPRTRRRPSAADGLLLRLRILLAFAVAVDRYGGLFGGGLGTRFRCGGRTPRPPTRGLLCRIACALVRRMFGFSFGFSLLGCGRACCPLGSLPQMRRFLFGVISLTFHPGQRATRRIIPVLRSMSHIAIENLMAV